MFAKIRSILSSPEAVISHKDKEVKFNVTMHGKLISQTEYDIFEQINGYWSMLSEQKQDTIFAIYESIQWAFDNIFNEKELHEYVRSKVHLLLVEHNLEDIHYWVSFKSNIIIPDDFKADYVESVDSNTSRSKTYTRRDYIKLISLSVALRVMLPIWGEYVHLTKSDTGTLFKEYHSFHLLAGSSLLESEPLQKLETYIASMASRDKFDTSNTLKGICSEDFNTWLLAMICVRRLCISDLRGYLETPDLVKIVYKFLVGKIQNTENNFENIVKIKAIEDSSVEGDVRTSALERYKMKTNLSPGEIIELEFSLADIHKVADRLSININHQMLERALLSTKPLVNRYISNAQLLLLRWVLKPVISPNGLMYLSKHKVVEALALVETVLWARGHEYLAILTTCYQSSPENNFSVNFVDSKIRVPAELTEELNRLYPFTTVANTKRAANKKTNLAAESIDKLTNELFSSTWRITADEEMIIKTLGSKSRKFPIKPDIKIDLTKLVIELGSRSWT